MSYPITFEFAVELEPNASKRDHWAVASKRARVALRDATIHTMAAIRNHHLHLPEKARITLSRLVFGRKKTVDPNNLPHAFKHVTDGVAMALRPGTKPGEADDEKHGLTFVFKQEPHNSVMKLSKATLIRVTIEEL